MGRLSLQEIEEALYEEDQISIELARLEGDDEFQQDAERYPSKRSPVDDPYRDEPLDSSQDDSEYYFSKKYDLGEDPYADMGYDDDWYDEDLFYEELRAEGLNALVLAFAI